MTKTKKLLIVVGFFLFGAIVGASGLYHWFSKKSIPQQVVNLVAATSLPEQSKELYLLMAVTEGLEERPMKDSKKALCHLIDIKLSVMNITADTLTAIQTWPSVKRINEYAIASIPSSETIEQSTKCEKEWLPNTIERSTPQADHPAH